jgi:DNA polymerase-3 subunit beta
MKFTVDSKQLEKLLLTVGSALSSNPIIPIMENYKVDVLQDRVVATATDGQVTITSHILNTSIETFSFCVGAKLLATLKNLPQQPLSLAYDYNKSTLVVKTATGRYRLPTQDVEDFPSMQEFAGEGVDLTGEEAITIFSTHAIASSDMLRDNLRCVYLDKTNTAIAATDAHKLIKIEMEKLEGLDNSMLIPKDTCKKALALLKVNDNVNIKSTENKVCFTIGNTIISAVLADASYPDYRAVIPRSSNIAADIDKNALLRMLKRIMPYTSKSTSMVRLTFTKDTLTVTAEDLDMGNKAEESISIQYQYDNPLVIGFNSRFVIDVLGQLTTDTINVEMQNASMPMVLKEDGSDAKTCILMPVMLHDV